MRSHLLNCLSVAIPIALAFPLLSCAPTMLAESDVLVEKPPSEGILFEGIGVAEADFETDTVGPSAFFVDEDGNAYLVDRVNNRLLYAGYGRRQQNVPLTDLLDEPTPEVLDLEVIGDQLVFLTTEGIVTVSSPWRDDEAMAFESTDATTVKALATTAFARSGYLSGRTGVERNDDIRFESTSGLCDGGSRSEIAALPWHDKATSPLGGLSFEIEMQRASEDVLTVRIRAEGNETWIQAAPVKVNGIISTAQAAGADRDGNIYLLVESVRDGGKIAVAASVYKFVRHDRNASIYVPVSRFDVPLKPYRTLPARYVRVNSVGDVWITRINAGETVWIMKAEEASIVGALDYIERSDLAARIPEDFLALTQPDETIFFETTSTYSTTREDILKRAEEFVTMEWIFERKNALPPSGNDAQCRKRRGSAWIAPYRLRIKSEGDVVDAMPYRWGGWDSVDGFINAIQKSAGDTCTCRDSSLSYCVVPGSKGIDCSGFVTRAWFESPRKKYGTSTLAEISTEKDWRDLKCGDILNRSGKHVRLFSRFLPNYGGVIEFYESSLDCGGVCKRFAPMASFRSYIAREFDYVNDGETNNDDASDILLE